MLLVAPMPPPAEGCSKPGDLLLCQIAFQPDTRKREIGSVYSADDADGADAKQRMVHLRPALRDPTRPPLQGSLCDGHAKNKEAKRQPRKMRQRAAFSGRFCDLTAAA